MSKLAISIAYSRIGSIIGFAAVVALAAGTSRAAAVEISTGVGDGSLTVGVDGYGSFGASIGDDASDAVYDPVGDVDWGDTAHESALHQSQYQLDWHGRHERKD